jgi:uncharacterized protein
MHDIKQGENEFYVEEKGEKVANVSFTSGGTDEKGREVINLDHTYVSDSLRGQGVGNALVKKAVEYARQENKAITAACPFAKKIFDDTAEYQDVLAE